VGGGGEEWGLEGGFFCGYPKKRGKETVTIGEKKKKGEEKRGGVTSRKNCANPKLETREKGNMEADSRGRIERKCPIRSYCEGRTVEDSPEEEGKKGSKDRVLMEGVWGKGEREEKGGQIVTVELLAKCRFAVGWGGKEVSGSGQLTLAEEKVNR